MSESNFYQTIPPFQNFNDFMNDGHFHEVPDDWSIIVTDVKGSTKAIAEGRYKEVNTIGAASIVVADKAMQKQDFPFVFGGDGATMLIPNSKANEVIKNLSGLKVLARGNFSLELRVGLVKVSELHQIGNKIEVAKYEITPGKQVAILRGNGVVAAEKMVKERPELYETKIEASESADLSGLSCRWLPIPNKRGKILTLLITARSNKAETYKKFLEKLNEILPDGLESSNPANVEQMSYKSFKQCLNDERKYHASAFELSYIIRVIGILMAVLIFKLGINPVFFSPEKYSQSMRTHSDFRKFDDVLRMVIDCSADQIKQIKSYLEQSHQNKELFYGLFESDNSLMTCFVESLNQGEHIHFIDADNGGYAMAAVQLKSQMKADVN